MRPPRRSRARRCWSGPPRSAGDPVVRAARARHPHLATKVILGGSLAKSLRGVDCVLSCVSSAGIESTVTGLPVIQLIPRGAGPILPPDRWGVFDNASTAGELALSLKRALGEAAGSPRVGLGDVFAGFERRVGSGCATGGRIVLRGRGSGCGGGLGSGDGPGEDGQECPSYGERDDGPGDPSYRERGDGQECPSYGERRDGQECPSYGAAERIAEMLIGRVLSGDSVNQAQWQPRRRVGRPPRQAIGIR